MIAVLDIALSGARAAMRRLDVSAANVANVGASAPASDKGEPGPSLYRPQRVEQTSQAGGGVSTTVAPVQPAFTLLSDGDGGFNALPNVNLVDEALQQSLALRSYQANLHVLKTADETQKTLLDATA